VIAIPAYTGSVLVSCARSLIETIVPTVLPQRQPHRSVLGWTAPHGTICQGRNRHSIQREPSAMEC